MSIVELCTAFRPGGIQRHVLSLAAWLRGRGHRVALAGTPGEWMNPSIDASFLALDLDGVAKEGGALPRRVLNALQQARSLRAFVLREGVDLIHAHESAPALVAGIATIGLSVPTVVTYHGSEPQRLAAFGRIARFAARRVIALSQRGAADLIGMGGVPAERIRVIGVGVERGPAVDSGAVQSLRRRLLGDGRHLVLTVARLAYQKGIDVLVEVARQTLARDPTIRFVVVGDGPLEHEARGWAAAAGVERQLAFVGFSDRPQEFLAAADLFLLPSRWEGLPITIVEAFQAGLPVVATDAAGVSELVDDAVGRLATIGDAAALTDQVLAICGDDALRARLGAAARERAAEALFSPASVHPLIEGIYAELVGAPRARAVAA